MYRFKNYKIISVKILKIITLVVVLGGLMIGGNFVFSQSVSSDYEINQLNLKIQEQKKQLQDLQSQQQQYEAQIAAKRKDKVSLSNQLSILDDRLAQAQLDIDAANLEINKTNLELQKIQIDSDNLDKSIETRKQHIANLLSSMYEQDQVSTLEVLLLNNSLTEFLNQAKYLSDTNNEITGSVGRLRLDKDKLDQNKIDLDQKNKDLNGLKDKLQQKKDDLSYDQANKSNLLLTTKSSEERYQSLLQQAKREQQQAETDIANTARILSQKMSQKDKNFLDNGNNTIAWPVPQNVITTAFHDSGYPYRNIIGEHPAIDIRAKQGTTVTAAADGYVAKVKFDGSTRYSYIMLIHGDGLSTVYGHVSAVYILADQYVTQGQAIGRSGGMPGGIGSGPFTTGPHLHFEVRLNGLPVNPELYLP
ncbi:peptidoglycan DD-metalloendopeptidase family protein [Candidatus Falkowbacteria bacterium]|uniref:M23ase beta-sheet core domain-containing protein n=1 Tax=Candidatus Falkowbacteria bacterium CG10_big_fil_rev_8_21_14_0_10_37_18 TaxID=1974562 RepID=A0A2H0VBK7_9BACT|nr:peptidoglycan DD-metalloendopeptidase family protein [Candidatus Falkowbacteria bacterium]OIO06093.1 MAG: hypothetical protein AUJ26_01670 [Candidatus Falkowbacteria bacterium CG1_02_37_21]PIR95670.1 MAG: hypothetical protein COT93_00890 [Candidatus Falkowbacteria bacterium CG10_big_fil_rev_8_21_14_0_10_37_18]